MRSKDELEYIISIGQEVAILCLGCGSLRPTGTYTTPRSYDDKYAISHGYCSLKCAEKQYPDIFSELEAELEK